MQRIIATTLIFSLCILTAFAGENDKQKYLNEHLQPFAPFVGKTWKGVFSNSTPEKPVIDIARWERALNGQAIRIMHSVNDGEYGGESLIVWDAKQQKLVYYYFTTAGFYTNGTFTFEDGKFISQEFVTGNENGITEVRGVGEYREDGSWHSTSKYLKEGKWVPGHEIVYTEAADAEVVFK